MTWALRRTDQADADLLDIWVHVAVDNHAAADRLMDRLEAAFRRTADFPHMGTPLDDMADHRTLVSGNYLIIYRVIAAEQACELVRVLHAARQWRDLL